MTHQVDTELLASFVVDPIQFEVEVQQRSVLLDSLRQEARSVVFYLVVTEI